MEQWVTEMMEQYGYLGLLLVMVVENLFPPIPSEVVLPFGGFMTTRSQLTVPLVIVWATVGSLAGAIILYGLGLVLSKERVLWIVDRWGRWLRIKPQDIEKSFDWFDRYGKWTVFFGRMVPLVRSLISIPAGMARMNLALFLLYTILGSLIWNTLLVGIGAVLGSSWHRIAEWIDVYSNIIYVILALIAIGVLVWLFRRKDHS
jgi:membrane protein DedA with SNARE-associated domain